MCCGCCVETYSRSSHEVVSVLRHSAPVTAAILNPKNHMQVTMNTKYANLGIKTRKTDSYASVRMKLWGLAVLL